MRISLVNLNLVAADAVGQCLLHQLRFHRRRGDEVVVYVQHPVAGLPAEVTDAVRVVSSLDLLAQQDEHFAASDLYVFHYTGRYDMLDVIPTLTRGVVIFYYHNVTPPELWGASRGQAELSADQAAVGPLTQLVDLIVTDSPFNAEELTSRYAVAAERVRVLPLAAPLDRFHPGPADLTLVNRYGLAGKNVLLYVGRVAGNKRVDLLVEALAQVRRHVDNTVLLVVGDHDSNPAFGEVMAQIRSRIHALKLDDAVIFTGRVDELPPYYRLADIYVSASLHEGFGVPLIEAMASGLPVIATHAGAQPWVVGDAGILVPPGKPDEMAHHIVNLLRYDMHLGELSRHSLRRAQDFSLEAYTAGWSKILDDVRDFVATRPVYPRRAAGAPPAAAPAATPGAGISLEDDLLGLAQAAKIVQPYTVRSGAPLVGPLIAWVRRNLTSHLREPYLDPTLRRQERFNGLLVAALRRLAQPSPPDADLTARVAALEAQTTALLATLEAHLDAALQERDPAAQRAALTALRDQVAASRSPAPTGAPDHADR